jgi:hypothetical protein
METSEPCQEWHVAGPPPIPVFSGPYDSLEWN